MPPPMINRSIRNLQTYSRSSPFFSSINHYTFTPMHINRKSMPNSLFSPIIRNHSSIIHPGPSHNSIAIYLAIRHLQKNHPSPFPSNIIIISDSRAAIQHIIRPLYKRKVTPIILFIRNMLQFFLHFHNCKLHFIWVPSHAGIPGNERADS